MAEYPGTHIERRLAPEILAKFVNNIFQACDMSEADARTLASSLVRADLRGIHSHGVMRVPDYVVRLTTGGVDPRGRPKVIKERGGASLVDGANAMGQISGAFAMRIAIERASVTGVAATAVGGSNHCGAMDDYVRMAIEADMIGIATTNALPTMAPWGGVARIVGLNPIGIGVPENEAGPVILDTALGATAHGKIEIYRQKRVPIPEGWALDKAGRPTTDAAAALEGLIHPIGAFKGIGLAVCMGILSTLLSGAAYGTELGSLDAGPTAGADGQFYLALDIGAFEDVNRFKARVDTVVAQIRNSPRAPGVERLYSPGEREAETAARNSQDGIPLNDVTIDGLLEAARQLGVDAGSLA